MEALKYPRTAANENEPGAALERPEPIPALPGHLATSSGPAPAPSPAAAPTGWDRVQRLLWIIFTNRYSKRNERKM
jgi:hypothetical protein